MENKKQKAIVVKQFGSIPSFDDFDIPKLNENDVLIKVIASTINPSDRARVKGGYGNTKVPFIGGLEGYGEIVEAGKQGNKQLVGKKVSFVTYSGSWAQYTVTDLEKIWEVDSDVPIECAASGIINPMTVIGIVETYKKGHHQGQKPKGLINTAAASALGRMMNKYCQREGIPLLNIVRRQEQVKILEEEGAKHIINTSDEKWLDQFKESLNTHGFNVLFDAIGGGDVTETLISHLKPQSRVYIYGKLTNDPFLIRKPLVALQGTSISNFMLFEWYAKISNEEKDLIKSQFSSLLKNELSTSTLKQIKLEQVPNYWEESEKRATEGKFTIKI